MKSNLEIINAKIFTRESLLKQLHLWRFKGDRIVFTNGCFDLLHRGHIDYLCKAADLGSRLVVGVNADESVKRLGKGASRPLQDQDSRALLVAALHFVSAVIVFPEDTPYELIRAAEPDLLVKGSDWKVEEVVGRDIVLARGGEVKLIDYLPGYSTTSIEKKIKEG